MTSGQLIEALKSGKIIYRKIYDNTETEYLFSFAPEMLEVRGFGCSNGTVNERLRDVIFKPEEWSIHNHPGKDFFPFPWSSDYKEIELPTEEFVLNVEFREQRITDGFDESIKFIKNQLNLGYKIIKLNLNSDIQVFGSEFYKEIISRLEKYLVGSKTLKVLSSDYNSIKLEYIG